MAIRETFAFSFLFLLTCSSVSGQTGTETYDELHRETLRIVNGAGNSTWKAGKSSYFSGKSMEEIKTLLGSKLSASLGTLLPGIRNDADLPNDFDARQKWPECPTVSQIRDQGHCGSCWAISAAEVASDRTCIASRGKFTASLSLENLLSCCMFCGYGCGGGYPFMAFVFWWLFGLVTGGGYDSHRGCQPYTVPPGVTPHPHLPYFHMCHWHCEDGHAPYIVGGLFRRSEADIRRDIMTNGPVQASFSVYMDFASYQSGVYQHQQGTYLGGHAVKIIGWGAEGDTPYWLVANSWNTTWGDEGFFKILRGSNECGIESAVYAALPKL